MNETLKKAFLHRITKKVRPLKKEHIQTFLGKYLKIRALPISYPNPANC